MFRNIMLLFVLSQCMISVVWSNTSIGNITRWPFGNLHFVRTVISPLVIQIESPNVGPNKVQPTVNNTGLIDITTSWPFGNFHFDHPVQSPVDIVTAKSMFYQLPELQFISHLSNKTQTFVNNTGHTVYIFMKDDYNETVNVKPPHLKGGPLKEIYILEQVHMHWGSSDMWGSEHFIDGESFSIEGHAVHYNSKYENITEAAKHKDGLCVITIFAEASNKENSLISPLVDILKDIPKAGMSKVLPSFNALRWIVSVRDVNDIYYTYPGSLTTSPYSENVIFIVFPKPLSLSFKQLQKFRTLEGNHDGEYILENKRHLQPLYNRPIFKSFIIPKEKATTNGV